MNKRIIVSILSVLLAQAAAADPMSGDLTVSVRGFPNDGGHAIAYLFREGDDVMKTGTAHSQALGTISGKQARLVFRNLKHGKYAVTVFQDANGNGILDHNSLNFPAEPLGFSNNFQLGLLSGLPSFEKLQFDFSGENTMVQISLE